MIYKYLTKQVVKRIRYLTKKKNGLVFAQSQGDKEKKKDEIAS